MRSKGGANEVISIMLTKDEMPPACVSNDAKDIVNGKFHHKLEKTSNHLKN